MSEKVVWQTSCLYEDSSDTDRTSPGDVAARRSKDKVWEAEKIMARAEQRAVQEG